MTKPRNDPAITQELLLSRFCYDPETGDLIRRVRGGPVAAGSPAGGRDRHGYLRVHVLGRQHFGHRLVWLMMTGAWPVGEVDHINRVKGDDRFANLRDVPKSDNVANAGARADNACGVRGVCRHRKAWKAEVQVRGERISLGVFPTKEAAGAAHEYANEWLRTHGSIPIALPSAEPGEPLAASEQVVADLWMQGLTPSQIGARLSRSMSSVSNSARRIRAKGWPLPRLRRRPYEALTQMIALEPQGER